MKNEDVEIGMRVVPFQKTAGEIDMKEFLVDPGFQKLGYALVFSKFGPDSRSWWVGSDLDLSLENKFLFNAEDFKPYRPSIQEIPEIFDLAVSTWGLPAQLVVTMEELAELTKEVAKSYRNGTLSEGLAEEIADVQIMIAQLLHSSPGLEDKVKALKDSKIERLAARLAYRNAVPKEQS